MRFLTLAACIGALSIGASPAVAAQINIDFEGITPGEFVPGDILADDCVTFFSTRSGNLDPAVDRSFVDVGSIITVGLGSNGTSSDIQIKAFADSAISDPNFVLPSPGEFDILMEFSDPIRAIALTTDEFNETEDEVRILALVPTGNPDEYEVIAFDSGPDDATSAPDNRLFLDTMGSFSHVLFQGGFNPANVDSDGRELEGFDDLRFIKAGDDTPLDPFGDPQVPEPSTFVLVALAIGGGLLVKRQSA